MSFIAMRRLLYVLICVFALCVVSTSCENKALNCQLDDLDTLLRVRPDSVYAVLDSMDTRNMSKSQRIRHALLLADAQNKVYIDFTTDSAMIAVADYYDHHGTRNEQMRAHYLLGCTYRDMGDVPMELQCFLDATEKADTTDKDCDFHTLAAVYGQIANLYHSQYLPLEELKALGMCERMAGMDNDTLGAIKAYELQLRAYYLLHNNDSVLSITKNARCNFLKLNHKQQAARLLCPAISILLDRNEVDSARKYMEIFESESGFFTNGKIISTKARMYYFCKGRMYAMTNNVDSARYYFAELEKSGWKEAAYQGFVNLYRETNNPDSLAKYANLFVVANDSARASTSTELIAQMAKMYDYAHQEKLNKELMINIEKEKLAKQTMILYVVIASLVVIILTLFFVYAYKEHYRKNKQQLAETITRFNSIKQLLEECETQKRELECKLASSKDMSEETINNYKEEISALNKRIEESNQQIVNYREKFTDVDFNAWLDKFLTAEIVFKYKDLLKPGKPGKVYSANDNIWQQTYDHFNKNASEFVKYINSEKFGLNELDVKVAMLTIFDFGTSETATLLDKSNNHITNIRKRITDKLFSKDVYPRNLRKELLEVMKTILEVSTKE